jgi:hypothetical protein
VRNAAPLFLLFLQEIISDRWLVSLRNPGFPAAQRTKEQRDAQLMPDYNFRIEMAVA